MEKQHHFPILIPTLILLCSIFTIIQPTSSQTTTPGFKCTASGATCNSLIDYKLPNTTTLSSVRTLFQIKNLRTLLAANNLPLNTPQNKTYPATTTLKIPFPCSCNNGRGISNRKPIYTVVPDDGLFHIAAEVFSRLVTFQQIQVVNNIINADNISVGQRLWVPLPCSCDEVVGEKVVHYGYSVPGGSSVAGIASQFNTTETVLLELNEDAKDLKADSILDVPLKACTTSVRNGSIDYPLLVPNGTYTLTANNCVRCQCNAANSWVLQCEPSGISLPNGRTCPSTQCAGTAFDLGNTTSDSNCNLTRCAYAGYNRNGTILTTLTPESTCPAGNNDNGSPSGNGSKGLRSSFVLVASLIALHLLR